ncbi:MAG: TetR/AcrR family transcriptional regulator [Gallionellaceae bacterium]|nr:MAG: TetR/AcrR family transcriptional regulator [Gallionellaceae bacterium]
MQSSDRRVQRTRRALRDALISLLVERGWDDINIQNLCERADVGRSTFYIHFQNKEELLVSGFDDLRAALRAQAAEMNGAADSMRFVRGLIEHAYEQRTLFRAIIGRRSGHVVQKRFREMVSRLVEEEISQPATGWQRDAGIRYVAGALVELLAWWVDTGNSRSADDIEHLFHQFSLPVIKQLREEA